MFKEWWDLLIGLVSVIIGTYSLILSIKTMLSWSKEGKKDDSSSSDMVKVGEPKRLVGGIVLVILGIYIIVKFFS